MNTEAIRSACDIIGSQTRVAAMLGITVGAVNQWCTGRKDVPLDKAIQIEGATKGAITVEQLKPEISLTHVRNGLEKPAIQVEPPVTTVFREEFFLKAHKAHSYVTKAIRDGYLPSPSTLTCLDCGAPAQVYDHRDYNKPLDVEHVCHACNIKRGPAIPFVHVNDR